MKNEMRNVILAFATKYSGNWERIYQSITNKDRIAMNEVNIFETKYIDNSITIIEDNYPNNFKDIYMPPLTIFTIGEKKLLQNDKSIVSLWGVDDYSKIDDLKLNKENTYALFYDDNKIDEINKLIDKDYKLVLVGKNNLKNEKIGYLHIMPNMTYVTEIPFEVKTSDPHLKQNNERNLFGISHQAICVDGSKETLDQVMPIFKFEERELLVMGDICDEYKNNSLIKKIDASSELFNKNLNESVDLNSLKHAETNGESKTQSKTVSQKS